MQFMSSSQRHTGVSYQGIQHSDDDMVKMFRDKLAARGARGILGMQRIFKIVDDNGNGSLDINEFWKALCDFRIALSPEECRQLFDLFDINGDGCISYDEMMRSVVGEMSPMRKALVKRAFDKVDRNGNGVIELDDIKGVYNAKQHPDVRSGKKTEDEVLTEFIDTFEVHHSLKCPSERDRKVTLKEFIEYYNNISASIDNEQYFELMITNAWNLNNQTYQRGWGGEY
jgi:Ca2+-binding EF-hand superfamily protein